MTMDLYNMRIILFLCKFYYYVGVYYFIIMAICFFVCLNNIYSLRMLAPEIFCNDIFLKVILLLTLHHFQPKNVKNIICHRHRYEDIGVLNLCGRNSTPLDFS